MARDVAPGVSRVYSQAWTRPRHFMRKKQPITGASRPKSQTARPPQLILMHKPYGVLCQFSPDGDHPTLRAVFEALPDGPIRRATDVYPAGRLDHDSEGLLILTNQGPWQARISQPRSGWHKTYWAQVEGAVSDHAIDQLRQGVQLNDGPARAVQVERMDAPNVPERTPPIRQRAHIPTAWLAITLNEGRNRQVRRMTAAVGHPTLRLIRAAIGPWHLGESRPGDCWQLPPDEVQTLMNTSRT